IRYDLVTGVQTCALPISRLAMDADAELHLGVVDAERRRTGRGHGATGERDADRASRRIDPFAEPAAAFQVAPFLGRGADDLLHQIGRASCREGKSTARCG